MNEAEARENTDDENNEELQTAEESASEESASEESASEESASEESTSEESTSEESTSGESESGESTEDPEIDEEEEGVKKIARSPMQEKLLAFVNNPVVSSLMMIATIYALIGLDFVAWFKMPSKYDMIIDVTSAIALFLFFAEFGLKTYAEQGYVWSFFFWLDFVAAVSLVPDVPWIVDPIKNYFGLGVGGSALSLARAGRAARAGARAGRIARVFKVLNKIGPFLDRLRGKGNDVEGSDDDDLEGLEPSAIGNVFSEKMTQKAILGVMGMLIMTSMFDYQPPTPFPEFALRSLEVKSDEQDDVIDRYIANTKKVDKDGKLINPALIYLAVSGLNQSENSGQKDVVEKTWKKDLVKDIYFEGEVIALNADGGVYVALNKPSDAEKLMRTGNVFHVKVGDSTDTKARLVVKELRASDADGPELNGISCRIVDAKSVAHKPRSRDIERGITQFSAGQQDIVALKNLPEGGDVAVGDRISYRNFDVKNSQMRARDVLFYETPNGSRAWFDKRNINAEMGFNGFVIIVFVVVLLGLGTFAFQADAQTLFITPIERMTFMVKTLAENPLRTVETTRRRGSHETGVIQDAMVKISSLLQLGFGEAGAKIIAENLAQEGELNPMVPGQKVDAIYGFCDIRNFTDATECLQEDVMLFVNSVAGILHQAVAENGGSPNKNIGDAFLLVWKDGEDGSQNPADGALRAFLRTMEEVKVDETLKELAKNSELQERLPGFETQLGFGLHLGWAIEGAIGSEQKIDATYLSPHVNISARLESATKQYGTQLLMSGEFVEGLSHEMRPSCRKIDVVTVKGSEQPVTLYTTDLDEPSEFTLLEYYDTFEIAVDHYLAGEWDEAVENLTICLDAWPSDQVAEALLSFMSDHGNIAPDDWPGYRVLDSK